MHVAGGGFRTALLQLGRLAGLELYGSTAAARHGLLVSLGRRAGDWRSAEFVTEIGRLTGDGVDAVFDGRIAHLGASGNECLRQNEC
jgi:NADPH2:quinone reductase